MHARGAHRGRGRGGGSLPQQESRGLHERVTLPPPPPATSLRVIAPSTQGLQAVSSSGGGGGGAPLAFTGTASFRARIVLATLTGRRIRIDGIRAKELAPGLRPFEVTFLRLVDALTNGSRLEINETGTSLKLSPGLVVGGAVEHDCGVGKGLGWFIEGVLPLLPFAKRAVTLTLSGVTNDDGDVTVDALRSVVLPSLAGFGLGEGLSLAVTARGAPPAGGGRVVLTCPALRSLTPLNLVEEGYIKKVRGVAYTARVSPGLGSRLATSARGALQRLLPDVFIFTDHARPGCGGGSPGYGLSLVAQSTSGCLYGAQRCTGVAGGGGGEAGAGGAVAGGSTPTPPEELGEDAAALLLDEVARGGCVGTLAQPLMFTLMALCPEDACRLRIGALGPSGIATLRLLKTFLGTVFHLKPETFTREELGEAAVGAAAAAAAAARGALAAGPTKRSRLDITSGTTVGSAGGGGPQAGAKRGKGGARREGEGEAPPPPPPTVMLAALTGGRSERSVLVTCLGSGYVNAWKKVT